MNTSQPLFIYFVTIWQEDSSITPALHLSTFTHKFLFTGATSGGASLLLLSLLTSFSFKPFTFVHSLRGGTRRFSRLYDHGNNNNRLHDYENNNNDSKQIVDASISIDIIYNIVTGYQQTILPSNESSFESQSLPKVWYSIPTYSFVINYDINEVTTTK